MCSLHVMYHAKQTMYYNYCHYYNYIRVHFYSCSSSIMPIFVFRAAHQMIFDHMLSSIMPPMRRL